MRIAKAAARARTKRLPEIRFEDQQLTSFGGLVVFQKLFADLGLARLLRDALRPAQEVPTRYYQPGTVVMCLIVHLILGFRRLREIDGYRDDPLVLHTLGLRQLPSVPTISRSLAEIDAAGVSGLRDLCRDLVLMRLAEERLRRVTLDFDGSVLSTGRHAEGAAVGFNRKKKGARSYYPLFCTVAQTGQILDQHHRSGNVHDSNGAAEFVERCVAEVRAALPDVVVEVRMDSAFFSDAIVGLLEELQVQYSISVPFERFPELKAKIEERRFWRRTPGAGGVRTGHFAQRWKPHSWDAKAHFVFIRSKSRVQRKGPIQLDLFEPRDEIYEYKVVVTNKRCRAGTVVRFHEGRGTQERVFGELKSQAALGYIPARRRAANEVFLTCSILAHNLSRELQMRTAATERRRSTATRAALWVFEELATLRRTVLQRAGRLTRPAGKLTLTLGPNTTTRERILRILDPASAQTAAVL